MTRMALIHAAHRTGLVAWVAAGEMRAGLHVMEAGGRDNVVVATSGWLLPAPPASADRAMVIQQIDMMTLLMNWVRMAINSGLVVELARQDDQLRMTVRGWLDSPVNVNRAEVVYGGQGVAT